MADTEKMFVCSSFGCNMVIYEFIFSKTEIFFFNIYYLLIWDSNFWLYIYIQSKWFYLLWQNFTDEDQLLVHKKKHDMILNLGNSSKNNGFVGKY